MKSITKMRRIEYSTKCNQIKVEKTRFGKGNPENDVIQDAQKVILDLNLKKSAILALRVFLAKNREFA